MYVRGVRKGDGGGCVFADMNCFSSILVPATLLVPYACLVKIVLLFLLLLFYY